MTENQKLREALQAIANIDDATSHSVDASAALDRIGQIARQALALPTADHLPDAGKMVVDHFPDATKMIETAAPGCERERFEAWWRTVQMRTFPKDYDIERLQDWGSIYKPKALDAWQARSALSARDAVDAQRYRWLRAQESDDFEFAVVKNPHFDVYQAGEELDAAIDAAMRKDNP